MALLPLPKNVTYPRPLTAIHQIEVTSRCNLRCVYCPSPKLDKPADEGGHGRAKIDMAIDTFERALEWAAHFQGAGTQGELSLTGIGEPLLHPEFPEMLRLAREALPDNDLVFSTNGLLLDRAMCEAIAPYRPKVYVSLHRPEKAGPAIELAREYGILSGHNTASVLSSFDWAGQVDWHVSAPSSPCAYLAFGWGVVLSDGRVTTCCLDASGVGVVGHVDDEIGSLSVKPYGLCGDCHMTVP